MIALSYIAFFSFATLTLSWNIIHAGENLNQRMNKYHLHNRIEKHLRCNPELYVDVAQTVNCCDNPMDLFLTHKHLREYEGEKLKKHETRNPALTLDEVMENLPRRLNFVDNKKPSDPRILSNFSPLERVLLTSNGNLTRVVSSYCNAPVHVHISKCEEIEDAVFERVVKLSVRGNFFCEAKSIVVLHGSSSIEAIKSKSVGLGQLFYRFHILPEFTLRNIGEKYQDSNGNLHGMWRLYDLESDQLSCRIQEYFVHDLSAVLKVV